MLVAAWALLDIVRFGFDCICRFCYLLDSQSPIRLPLLSITSAPTICSLHKLSMYFDDYDLAEEAYEKFDDIYMNLLQSKIAYVHNVTTPLIPGSYIVVNGRTKPGCLRFAVDFQCGNRSMKQGTIAFHFNPRLQESYVVRNCMLRGIWGEEEITSITPLTLSSDEQFKLVFFVTHEQIMVSINSEHFCSFRHRVPIERVNNIVFVGDILIYSLDWTLVDCYPFVKGHNENINNVPVDKEYEEDDKSQIPIPYTGKFQAPLEVGTQVEICGTVKLLPHSFFINLQCGINLYPHPMVPLHLNPRFSASCGTNAFVRNCWLDGKWLKEERAPGFPFSPGYPFSMVVRLEEHGFVVWVNDHLIAEYPNCGAHQASPDAVYIQGDLFLHHISVQHKQRTSFVKFRNMRSSMHL